MPTGRTPKDSWTFSTARWSQWSASAASQPIFVSGISKHARLARVIPDIVADTVAKLTAQGRLPTYPFSREVSGLHARKDFAEMLIENSVDLIWAFDADLRFTASQYALISAAASVVGRVLTGTTAGAIVESVGFVNFYWLTTVAALPGIILFWLMMRSGLVDSSIGTAGVVGEGDARAKENVAE